ncbi:bifunctional acetate--CoA ligase family protein/GNAT family N-acetyltransferase [Cohaesibacter sp. CAU 1516]|uniref:bifunctional acetate--CoA ligase family protein/GNAT family N-acetyltransferase n=1 Tax=Cohaesibacter sp. CAU 1516 TaxID=2576038 RepID=UPI0010FEB171|nr:bifunctional acetate--CoA ligase family protein/GNAT family N-acetyltransferase [Cohaesibacter sp. CAU 1516]TLP45684.1 bifunctional acetate--CoA ligase family protein/GNAT family N-acetyltransferase [Cohaesibacter sp. CAU 1516]
MSSYNLDVFFRPRNVTVIGASAREGSIGNAIVRNLLAGKFKDKLTLVNPKGGQIDGHNVLSSLEELEGKPDLAVVAVAAQSVVDVIETLGKKGCRGAIIITTESSGADRSIAKHVAQIAAGYGMRVVGPNCVGILAPRTGLNASFCHLPGLQGDLAMISQSGAIVTSVVDWATRKQIGFSGVVSLGEKSDVDFGDLMDHFAMDPFTRAILLYVESIQDARKFMSSARAAARAKPVVVMKSGRHTEGVSATAWRNNRLPSEDAVYQAAFDRAGLLRVHDLDEFFDAVETLTHVRKLRGANLTIICNGTGLTALAADDLVDQAGSLTELDDAVIAQLDAVLPTKWSRSNPINILGTAGPDAYRQSLEILMEDRNSHAILIMHCPTALNDPVAMAQAVIDLLAERKKNGKRRLPVFTCWLGGGDKVWTMFEEADIPHYATPADAMRGYSYVIKYMQAQDQLMRMPPAFDDSKPDLEVARKVIGGALARGEERLTAVEVSALLEAYDLPIAAAIPAANAQEAQQLSIPLIARHGAVVVKIDSPDVRYKSDIGGVVLNLVTPEAVGEATTAVMDRARAAYPDGRIHGVTLHPMIRRPHAVELTAGMHVDAIFGPVMVFGRGGTAVEVIRDKALELPPLDMLTAKRMIGKTRVNRRLAGYRDTPPCDREQLASILVKLSRMVADLPQITALDLNPLLADSNGYVITDASVHVAPSSIGIHPHKRFAVKPYPKEWEQVNKLKDGRSALIRPMRPEDESLFPDFFDHVTDDDLRLRFFTAARSINHAFIARLTQIDYARSMAFIALDQETGDMLGSVRLMGDADHNRGEYAVMVRSDLKGLGLGWKLMKLILLYAEKDGFNQVEGEVLRTNRTMREMCEALGFKTRMDPDDPDLVHMVFDVPNISDKINALK